MSSIQSKILGLLETSSIPAIYKGIIRNILPTMSGIQQEDLFKTLQKEQNEMSKINIKRDVLRQKYEAFADAYDKDPNNLPEPTPDMVEAAKSMKRDTLQKKSDFGLSALRGSMAASK